MYRAIFSVQPSMSVLPLQTLPNHAYSFSFTYILDLYFDNFKFLGPTSSMVLEYLYARNLNFFWLSNDLDMIKVVKDCLESHKKTETKPKRRKETCVHLYSPQNIILVGSVLLKSSYMSDPFCLPI